MDLMDATDKLMDIPHLDVRVRVRVGAIALKGYAYGSGWVW